jgi:nitrite reductase/ring-hydroxylating ferredoxin subunit
MAGGVTMDVPIREFVLAGSLEELKAKGRLVLHGGHRPILVIYDRGRVFALDNRCPHMGFPLERGSVEDGILTCHWHHARFDLESGCTFDLWADDVPICPVELRDGQVWVKTMFGMPILPSTGANGSPTVSPTTSGSSSPRPCMVSSRPTYRLPTS